MSAELSSGQLSGIQPERPYDGVTRRTIRGSHHTLVVYEFKPGAAFPMHRHEQEQTTIVHTGEVEFISEAGSTQLRAGDWSLLAGGVPHRIIAGAEGARLIAVVAPARDTYEVLDDA